MSPVFVFYQQTFNVLLLQLSEISFINTERLVLLLHVELRCFLKEKAQMAWTQSTHQYIHTGLSPVVEEGKAEIVVGCVEKQRKNRERRRVETEIKKGRGSPDCVDELCE